MEDIKTAIIAHLALLNREQLKLVYQLVRMIIRGRD